MYATGTETEWAARRADGTYWAAMGSQCLVIRAVHANWGWKIYLFAHDESWRGRELEILVPGATWKARDVAWLPVVEEGITTDIIQE